MIPSVIENFSLFVDGRGYAGKCPELTVPKLTRKTRDYQAGGMSGPVTIDMGMDKMEAEFTLEEYNADVLRLFGITDMAYVALRFTGSIIRQDGSTPEPVEVFVRGRIREMDFGGWKAAEGAQLKVMLDVAYYKLTMSGSVEIEIDPVNMIEVIGGVDRLAQTRNNLGV